MENDMYRLYIIVLKTNVIHKLVQNDTRGLATASAREHYVTDKAT